MFKAIEGYEGVYSVSNLGRVYSHTRLTPLGRKVPGRYLTLCLCSGGYPMARLYLKGAVETIKVHKLVALHFVDGYKEGLHNHSSNLEWCTSQYNVEYSVSKHYLVTFPDGRLEKVFNLSKFCRQFGLSKAAMSQVSYGRVKQHKSFKCIKLD